MKKHILTLSTAAVLSAGVVGEAGALTCDCGIDGHESECCWEVTEVTDNGKTEKILTIIPGINSDGDAYTNVTMKDYGNVYVGGNSPTNAPWNNLGITRVEFKEGINNVGEGSFRNLSTIKSADLPYVKEIGESAFYAQGNTSHLESVYMPNVEKIGSFAFRTDGKSYLTSIDMPKVTTINNYAFGNRSELAYIGFDGSNIESIASNAFYNTNLAECSISNLSACGSCPSGQAVMPGRGCVADCGTGYSVDSTNRCVANTQTESQGQQGQGGSQESEQQGTQVPGSATSSADCAASGKYWQEGECVSSCGASFKFNDGWCDRQRYTPAEAAAILNDDDNTITITFKK